MTKTLHLEPGYVKCNIAERDLHETFRECRRHGEWFDPHPVLIMAIDHIRASMGPKKLAEYDCFKHALY